ncbi:hypothetical protein N2152v2_010310 [Parachlorella kessleri]
MLRLVVFLVALKLAAGDNCPYDGYTLPDFACKLWFCSTLDATPTRVNDQGDVECASYNAHNCLRPGPGPNGYGSQGCQDFANSLNANPPTNPPLRPLACGAMLQQECGYTGYDTSDPTTGCDHFCANKARECSKLVGVRSDPVITGFDGRSFHFDDTGDFTLFETGDGFQVQVTFVAASAPLDGRPEDAYTWTSSVRVTTPHGDTLACDLPAILPNTSKVQVAAMPAAPTRAATSLSASHPSVEFQDMSASIALSEVPSASREVVGCNARTPSFEVAVRQISGYQQAELHPETEGWAAPYTWLNTDVRLLKPLVTPVTGILGSTYRIDSAEEQAALRVDGQQPSRPVGAAVAGARRRAM